VPGTVETASRRGGVLAESGGGSRLAGLGAPEPQQRRGGAFGGQVQRARSKRLGVKVMQEPLNVAAGAPHTGGVAGSLRVHASGRSRR